MQSLLREKPTCFSLKIFGCTLKRGALQKVEVSKHSFGFNQIKPRDRKMGNFIMSLFAIMFLASFFPDMVSGKTSLRAVSTCLTAPGSLSVAPERKITRPCPLQCRCKEKEADCSNRNLKEIPENLNMAKIVDLHGNNIKDLNPATMRSLQKTRQLDLSHNHLSTITECVFSGFSRLEHLKLSHNPLVTIPAGVFQDLTNLLSLQLDHMLLERLPQGSVERLTKLRRLSLINNKLKSVDEIFRQKEKESLQQLHHLDLSFNFLESLPQEIFLLHPKLKYVRLVHNRWRCDQSLLFLSEAMTESPHMFPRQDRVLCSSPIDVRGMKVTHLKDYTFSVPTAGLQNQSTPASRKSPWAKFHTTRLWRDESEGQAATTGGSQVSEPAPRGKRVNSATIIIVVLAVTVLALVLTVLGLAIALRNLRRWKRVYRNKNEDNNTTVAYNVLELSNPERPVPFAMQDSSRGDEMEVL